VNTPVQFVEHGMNSGPQPNVFYKATRPDGTDFRTGTVDYAAALRSGHRVSHPDPGPMVPGDAATFLSVSTAPAETLRGGRWPCRLFEVQIEGEAQEDPPGTSGLQDHPHRRGVKALRVRRELQGHLAFGLQGLAIVRLIGEVHALSDEERRTLEHTDHHRHLGLRPSEHLAGDRDAAYLAALSHARSAAWYAAQDALSRAVFRDVQDTVTWPSLQSTFQAVTLAAMGEVVRDVIGERRANRLGRMWQARAGEDQERSA